MLPLPIARPGEVAVSNLRCENRTKHVMMLTRVYRVKGFNLLREAPKGCLFVYSPRWLTDDEERAEKVAGKIF